MNKKDARLRVCRASRDLASASVANGVVALRYTRLISFELFWLAASAGRAGVEVTLEIYPEMIHGFQGLAHAGIPEAVAALRRVADYVGARLS